MKRRGTLDLFAIALVMWAQGVSAQSTDLWRTFTQADGLAETACRSVTLVGSDTVLIRHPHTNAISIFDGYKVTVVPGETDVRSRIYSSPGGQLWAVGRGGLRVCRDGVWLDQPVAEIARQQEAGVTNEIQLLPVRQGLVFTLLADRLLAVHSDTMTGSRVNTIRRADATSLGGFRKLIPASDGGLWVVGTRGYAKLPRPLSRLKPENQWEESSNMPAELVQRHRALASVPESLLLRSVDTAVGADGAVWLAGAWGLLRRGPAIWKPVGESSNRTPRAGSALAEALARLNPSRDADTASESWQAGLIARNGDVWLGGANKIVRRRKGTWLVFSSTNHLGPEDVVAFAESPEGRVCCATPRKVWEFDGRNWLSIRRGLDRVAALHFSRDGVLWVATSSALHRCVRGAWVKNDTLDGLPSDVVTNVYEDRSGRILAATAKGTSAFNPEADTDAPRTFIRPPKAGEATVREGGTVRLSFTGRDKWDVTLPDRLVFSYRLDDREWSPFQEQTEAVFVNLPVGQHYFQVRAMDRNANIDRQAARLEFAVLRPWYRETRLVVILTVALGLAVFFAALAFNRHHRLRRSYAEVERQVAERTRELELAQRELLHGQKMNALGTLAAGIAHDFNNVLSVIKGSAQLIEENADQPGKIRTRVDRIKTVVEQGAGIVNAMLGFSSSSSERPGPCEINAAVEDTVRLLGDRFLREVNVRFNPAPDLPETVTVKTFVQQILLNCIFNAAEAMDARKEVALSTHLADTPPKDTLLAPKPAEGYIAISVRDTGCGIKRESLQRIFEPFFTTKALSSKRGTGLGLSMAYELAKKLHAGLAVESTPGQGSTFTLVLPLQETAE